jgi:hypothetical protein
MLGWYPLVIMFVDLGKIQIGAYQKLLAHRNDVKRPVFP